MAPPVIQFVVQFMPPTRPAGALRSSYVPTQARSRALRMAFNPDDTFHQAWKRIREDFDKAYAEDEREYTDFIRLQAPIGVDIVLSSTIGSLFSADTPLSERTLYVEQAFVDHQSSIAPGSALQPAGYKRKLFADLTPDKQKTLKRRRIEEIRYGSALSALDADTPVMSREHVGVIAGAADNDNGNEEEEQEQYTQKVDMDGFKIPSKKIDKQRRPRYHRQNSILVQDSQGESRQKPLSTVHLRAAPSAPLNSSSPAEEAAARLNTAAPQSDSVRPRHHSSSRTPTAAQPRRSTIPTPDSNEHRRLSNEGPSSVKRPPSVQTSASAQSTRFQNRQSAPISDTGHDMIVEDPIVDDDFANGADEEFSEPPRSRGRTRTRSPEDSEYQRPAERSDLPSVPYSSQHTLGQENEESAETTAARSDRLSSSVLGPMPSSQSSHQSSDRASRLWTAEEDRQLLNGAQAGLSTSAIIKRYGFTRSDSSLRNRRRILLAQSHNGILPKLIDSNNKDFSGQRDRESAAAPPLTLTPAPAPTTTREPVSSTAPARWQESDLTILRKAIGAGVDPCEIQKTHFLSRTEGAVRRKIFQLRKDMKHDEEQISASGCTSAIEPGSKRNPEHGQSESDHAVEDEDAITIMDLQAIARDAERDRKGRLSESPMDSSPPQFLDENRSQSPETVFARHELPHVNKAQVTYGSGQKAKVRPVSGTQRQTRLPFEKDKRKNRDGPPRPSTAEVDAQYSRQSARGNVRPPNERETNGGMTDTEEAVVISSENVSDRDVKDYEKSADEEGEDEQSEAEPYTAQDLPDQTDRHPQIFDDSMLLEHFQAPSSATDSPESPIARHLDEEGQSFEQKHSREVDDRLENEAQPERQPVEPTKGCHSREIPTTNRLAAQLREERMGHLAESQLQSRSRTAPTRESPLATVHSDARPSSAREALLKRLPQQQTLPGSNTRHQSSPRNMDHPRTNGESRYRSQDRSHRQSTCDIERGSQPQHPVGEVEPWVPFEERPRTRGGKIDAGRANFPMMIAHDHHWVDSDDKMYSQAKERAKPEWVQEMYEYIKTENLIMIRMTAGDQQELQKLWKKQLHGRKVRRKKLSLPPLHTLRKDSDIGDIDDRNSNYEPHLDEDDNLDYDLMCKIPPCGEAGFKHMLHFNDYPSGVDHSRRFKELESREDEYLDSIIKETQPMSETEHDNEDEGSAGLPTVPLEESVAESQILGRANSQDLVQGVEEIAVYDDARRFVRTRRISALARSPVVELDLYRPPFHLEDDQPVAGGDDTRISTGKQSVEQGFERGVGSKVTSGSNINHSPDGNGMVEGGEDWVDNMLACAEAEAHNADDRAQGGKKKRRRKTKQGVEYAESQHSDDADRVDATQDAHDNEDGQNRESTDHSSDINNGSLSLSALSAARTDQRRIEDNHDRHIMPPPAVIPHNPGLLPRQRQESVSSQLTSDTSASLSKRGLRRQNSRQRKSRDSSDSQSMVSEVVAAASPEAQRSPRSEDDSLASIVTAPETQEVADSIEMARPPPTTAGTPSPQTRPGKQIPQIRRTPVAEAQRFGTTPKSSVAQGLKRLLGFSANIPAPPKHREMEAAEQVKLPYASDDEDSSSDDSD